jgi:hypothetical protein
VGLAKRVKGMGSRLMEKKRSRDADRPEVVPECLQFVYKGRIVLMMPKIGVKWHL